MTRPNPPASGRRAQSGASLIAGLYVLITLGVIILVAVRSVPVYMNDRDIQNALNEVADTPALQSADTIEIRQALSKRFQAGYANGVSARDVTIDRDNGARVLSLRYEARRPLFFNIDMVYSFHDTARMTGASAR